MAGRPDELQRENAGGGPAAGTASAGGGGKASSGGGGGGMLRVAALCVVVLAALRQLDLSLLQQPGARALYACVGTALVLGAAYAARAARGGGGGGAAQRGRGKFPPKGSVGHGVDEPEGEPEVVEDSLRWSFMPSTGVRRANTQQPVVGENDFAKVKCLVMHRPTHEPARDKAGNFPYSWHMHGRKRLWEVRVQMQFKVNPQNKIYFGLEMVPGPQSSNRMVKRIQGMLLAAIKRTIGKDFYQTAGDDPSTTSGEVEPPSFAMPLWALDQFDVVDLGKEPDLTGDFANVGIRRTDGLQAYVEAMKGHLDTLSCDKVYTLCFWGVSQFIDVINWEFKGLIPGMKLDANKLCGRPPVNVVMYQLHGTTPGEEEPEGVPPRKHYDSQKDYYFKVALWSLAAPPEAGFLRQLLGECVDHDSQNPSGGAPDGERGTGRLRERRLLQKVLKPMNAVFGCSEAVQDAPNRSASSQKAMQKWVKASQKLLGGCMGGSVASGGRRN